MECFWFCWSVLVYVGFLDCAAHYKPKEVICLLLQIDRPSSNSLSIQKTRNHHWIIEHNHIESFVRNTERQGVLDNFNNNLIPACIATTERRCWQEINNWRDVYASHLNNVVPHANLERREVNAWVLEKKSCNTTLNLPLHSCNIVYIYKKESFASWVSSWSSFETPRRLFVL